MKTLFELAAKERINVMYLQLRHHKDSLWGLYAPARPGRNPTIYLDAELLNPSLYRLARCVLAEEIGHHFTGIDSYFFKLHTNYSMERKMTSDDEKALRWATNFLIPTSELISIIKERYYECGDLADYYGVTAWFMYRKLEFIQYHIRAKRHMLSWKLASQLKISCI